MHTTLCILCIRCTLFTLCNAHCAHCAYRAPLCTLYTLWTLCIPPCWFNLPSLAAHSDSLNKWNVEIVPGLVCFGFPLLQTQFIRNYLSWRNKSWWKLSKWPICFKYIYLMTRRGQIHSGRGTEQQNTFVAVFHLFAADSQLLSCSVAQLLSFSAAQLLIFLASQLLSFSPS